MAFRRDVFRAAELSLADSLWGLDSVLEDEDAGAERACTELMDLGRRLERRTAVAGSSADTCEPEEATLTAGE